MLRNFALQAATTKATQNERNGKKKKLYKPFYLWLCSSFWLPFWTGNFYVVVAAVAAVVVVGGGGLLRQLRVQLKLVGDACLGHMCVLMPLGKSFLKAPKDDRDVHTKKLSIADRANV